MGHFAWVIGHAITIIVLTFQYRKQKPRNPALLVIESSNAGNPKINRFEPMGNLIRCNSGINYNFNLNRITVEDKCC